LLRSLKVLINTQPSIVDILDKAKHAGCELLNKITDVQSGTQNLRFKLNEETLPIPEAVSISIGEVLLLLLKKSE